MQDGGSPRTDVDRTDLNFAGFVRRDSVQVTALFLFAVTLDASMTEIIASRVTGRIDGDFVVFLIGMRINKFWKPHKWLPVLRAMPKMLKELDAAPPEVGFLGHNGLGGVIVQYWRSFDHLERYARDRSALHWPAWVEFNRRMKDTRGDVGIWHETYKVRAGEYEAVYSGMPPYGLGKFGARSALSESTDSARQRLSTSAPHP